jgi:hypothetical protein
MCYPIRARYGRDQHQVSNANPVARAGSGVLAIIAGTGILAFGIYDQHHWVPEYHLCKSGIGQLGQAFNSDASHMCTTPNILGPLAVWAIVIGVITIIVGGIKMLPDRRPTGSPNATGTPTARTATTVSSGGSACAECGKQIIAGRMGDHMKSQHAGTPPAS